MPKSQARGNGLAGNNEDCLTLKILDMKLRRLWRENEAELLSPPKVGFRAAMRLYHSTCSVAAMWGVDLQL